MRRQSTSFLSGQHRATMGAGMNLEVAIEDENWRAAGLAELAERAARAVFDRLTISADTFELSILACDDARIAALNADFRGKPQPTNVLSWPSADRTADSDGDRPAPPTGDPELGDIALAFETCQREAAEQGKRFEQHILHLIVHGLLHLLGYDHARDGDADLMESTETAILQVLGVPDPYS